MPNTIESHGFVQRMTLMRTSTPQLPMACHPLSSMPSSHPAILPSSHPLKNSTGMLRGILRGQVCDFAEQVVRPPDARVALVSNSIGTITALQ
eukprot:1011488-Pyramimonas_sp.AAC.1